MAPPPRRRARRRRASCLAPPLLVRAALLLLLRPPPAAGAPVAAAAALLKPQTLTDALGTPITTVDNVHKQTTVIEPTATSSSTSWVQRMLNQLNGATGDHPIKAYGDRNFAGPFALWSTPLECGKYTYANGCGGASRGEAAHCIWCVDIDMCVQGSPDAGPDSVGKIALISKSVRCERWLAHAI